MTWQEKLVLRDALSGWRTVIVARYGLTPDAHYDAIERHAYAVWNRDSHPTVPIPAATCPRCTARKPLDGPCVSCQRVRA